MNVSIHGAEVYFEIPIFGGIPITETTVSSFAVMVLLCFAGWFLGRNLKKRPGGKQVLAEKIYELLNNLVCEAMGPHNAHWTPYIGTLFFTSLLGSLIGMSGFIKSSTSNLMVTMTWALMTSGLIWYNSIKNFGFKGWLHGFAEPTWVLTPINIISEIAQPLSLGLRHFGNVFGGSAITAVLYAGLSALSTFLIHLVGSSHWIVTILCCALGIYLLIRGIQRKKMGFKIIGTLTTVLGALGLLQLLGIFLEIPIFQVGIPAVLSLYFDVFSGLIQAFVFCLLSMVYISGSCPPPESKTSAEA